MNKRAVVGWIIFGLIIFLLLAGIVYFKFTPNGLAIGSGKSSVNIDYNGTVAFNNDNQTTNSSNSSAEGNKYNSDYKLSFNTTNK